MEEAVLDASVRGYEGLIEDLELPDPDDHHVLAAAIHCGADRIITSNVKDFPSDVLFSHGVEAQHPDDFVLELMDADEDAVIATAHRHRNSPRDPPKTVEEYLMGFEHAQLRRTAARLALRAAEV